MSAELVEHLVRATDAALSALVVVPSAAGHLFPLIMVGVDLHPLHLVLTVKAVLYRTQTPQG